MIALLAAERVKLVSTRSPWWCAGLAVGLVVGLTVLLAVTLPKDVDVTQVAIGSPLGMVLVAVAAVVATTGEYQFGTIRITFATAPGRSAAVLAKAVVLAVAACLTGVVAAAASWAVSWMFRATASVGEGWPTVLAAGAVFALAAVLAVALGTLLRRTAGALTVLLVWALLVENLVTLIPTIGPRIHGYLPFANLANALAPEPGAPFGPWGSLVYVAGLAVGLMTLAAVAVQLRDA